LISLFILVPLAGLILLNLPVLRVLRRATWGFALAVAVAEAGAVLLAPAAWWTTPTPMDRFFAFALAAPDVSRVLLLSIGIVLFAALAVARSMIEDPRRRSNFASLLLVSLVGMNGAVLVTDLFSLYVFLEVASVASFVLIAFNRDSRALEGAFKYIILSVVATVLMVSAVALLLMVAGGTSYEAVRAALDSSGDALVAKIAVGAFIAGLFIKGGLVPFHGWLPDAYEAAPAPVSILLAGIVTKVMGIYALVRLAGEVFVPAGPLGDVLMLVGAVSIVVGALAALVQTDLKRMLAYSSISQVGYIVLGVGCFASAGPSEAASLALVGAVFHLFNHAIFKSLLFVNSAAIEQRLGTTDMNRMRGLGSRMPLTGTTSVIAALSMAGIPPLAGFWSKLIIVIALWQAHDYGYAGLAVLMSVVTLAYMLVMQRRIFFGKVADEFAHVEEAEPGLVVPALVLAILVVAVGLLVPWVLDTFMLPVAGLF